MIKDLVFWRRQLVDRLSRSIYVKIEELYCIHNRTVSGPGEGGMDSLQFLTNIKETY